MAGVELTVYRAGRAGCDRRSVRKLMVWAIIAAVVGARLFYVVLDPGPFLEHPLEVFFLWKGGVVFSGGVAAGTAAAWIVSRPLGLDPWSLSDAAAPGIALGDAVGRIGCLLAGCCYGLPTKLPWGIVFRQPYSHAPTGIPLHPTQVYTGLVSLGIFILLLRVGERRIRTGGLLCLYLGLYASTRLVLERFRGDLDRVLFGGTMTLTEAAAVLILCFAAVLWVYLGRKRDRAPVRNAC